MIHIIYVFILFILVAACSFLVLNYLRKNTNSPANEAPIVPQQENNSVNLETSPQVDPAEETPAQAENPDKTPLKYSSPDPNVSETLTGAITFAGVNGEKAAIRVNIDQYLSGGTCTLSMSAPNGQTYTDTAEIVTAASTSTCAGFDIATTNLSSGTWSFTIKLDTGDKSGTINGELNLWEEII